MPKRIPLELEEHRELGERLKQMEREAVRIMHTLSDRVGSEISDSWRRRMCSHFHRYQIELENQMMAKIRKEKQQPPNDWGLIYYGPVEAEKKEWA